MSWPPRDPHSSLKFQPRGPNPFFHVGGGGATVNERGRIQNLTS